MTDLFRKEATTHATRRLSGEVVLAAPLSNRMLSFGAIAIVAVATLAAATASYARKETVIGWLTPDAGIIRQAAPQGGIIETIHVKEGAAVVAGQPIATVRLSGTLQTGDAYLALKQTQVQLANAATTRAHAMRQTLNAEARQLVGRQAALEREIVETKRRVALQTDRVRLARAEVDRAEIIAAQGYLPRRDLDARRSAALLAEQELSAIAETALSMQRAMGEISARLVAIPNDQRAADADAGAASATLMRQRIETEAQSSYVIVASVAGRVVALPANRGQSVPPSATVAIISPIGSTLQVELYAPSRAIGFVREGQPVRVMYQAFPYQKFGAGDARITAVSRTVLAPTEVSIPGLPVQEPVFRMTARLQRDTINAYGQVVPLQPGMLLSADVIVDRRTLLEWLLDPLYATGRR